MATININATSNDIININVANAEEKPLSKEELDAIFDKYNKALQKRAVETSTRFWYEVWIDFDEVFNDLYPMIKDLPFEGGLDLCWGYLCRREAYYSSPTYYQDLDNMLKNAF